MMMNILLVVMVSALYSILFMLVMMGRALCVLSLVILNILDITLMMVVPQPLSNLAMYFLIYLHLNLLHLDIYFSASNFNVRYSAVCGFHRTLRI